MVSYSIEWNDPSPFDSQLNTHHAFINFAEILMYVPDRRAEDTAVTFNRVPADWKIITALPAAQADHAFSAPSYDALVDAPVEIGEFGEFEFDNDGAHFRVAVDSKNRERGPSGKLSATNYRLRIEAHGRPAFQGIHLSFSHRRLRRRRRRRNGARKFNRDCGAIARRRRRYRRP